MNCNCIEEVNKKLKEHNLRLSGYAFIMPSCKPVFTINTEWIDEDKAPRGKKKRPTSMFVSHCPFGGSGTTAEVAMEHGRAAILCEMKSEYLDLIRQRTAITPGLPLPI